MSVIAIPRSTKARLVLAAGTNSQTGKAITKNVYLSKLASNPDGDKIMAVVEAAAEILAYPVSYVETTEVKALEQGA